MLARLILAVALGGSSLLANADFVYGKVRPIGRISTTTPLISWGVRPLRGATLKQLVMRLNGRQVEAKFNSSSGAVEFKPDRALMTGVIEVSCQITSSENITAREGWSFEITSGDSAPDGAFAEANQFRKLLGLPAFLRDRRLEAAAEAHSRYTLAAKVCGHIEEPGRAGFTGRMPQDRVRSAGFSQPVWEVVGTGSKNPSEAVRALFDAPYHRIPFMQPGTVAVGASYLSGALTMDIALGEALGTSVSPADRQLGVPTSWDGNESPSPLRLHPVSGPVGYPIVFGNFSPMMERLNLRSMILSTDEGQTVPCFLNTPANDSRLRNAAILIPQRPLQPNTWYRVTVRATSAGGNRLDQSWSFRTR